MPTRIRRKNIKNKISKHKTNKSKSSNFNKKDKHNKKSKSNKKYKKQTIPKAVREQVWVQNFGKCFEHKCYISWCDNLINVYDFHIGHDKPESKGGTLEIDNLKPICSRCNLSMSNNYTIESWNNTYKNKNKCCIIC